MNFSIKIIACFLFLVICGFAVADEAAPVADEHEVGVSQPVKAATPKPANDDFTCSGKRTCGQMNSCAEARFYLTQCGVSSLDRDKDGIPCESICR